MSFSFFDVFIVIAVMLLMAVPGFVLRKVKLVDKSAIRPLSMVLLYVCQPFLTLKAFVLSQAEPSGDLAINMLIMFGFSVAAHIVTFFILKLIFRTKDPQKKRGNGALTICGVFSNAGFMGIPFIEMLTGNPKAVIYATVFMCVFNILIWTLGVYIVTGDIKMMRPLKALLNPAILVLALAVPLFFLPAANVFAKVEMLGKGVKYIGEAALPVSMSIVGIRMADISFKSLFTSARVYVVAAVKLVMVPLIVLALTLPFLLTGALNGLDPEHNIIMILVMLTAIPPAASSIAITERFDGDVDTAAKGFLLATLLSIITLPSVLMLLLAVVK